MSRPALWFAVSFSRGVLADYRLELASFNSVLLEEDRLILPLAPTKLDGIDGATVTATTGVETESLVLNGRTLRRCATVDGKAWSGAVPEGGVVVLALSLALTPEGGGPDGPVAIARAIGDLPPGPRWPK